MNWLVW